MKAPSRWLATLFTVVLPGLGHYYAGSAFRTALSVTFASVMVKLLVLGVVPRFVTWRQSFAVGLLAAAVFLAVTIHSARSIARRDAESRPKRTPKQYTGFILAALALVFVFDAVTDAEGVRAIKNYHVPTAAMEPTIKVGDRVVARLGYDPAKAVRGDLIVFRYPKDPEIRYIKRVVGLPGDRLKLVDGTLVVNGVEQPRFPGAAGANPFAARNWPKNGEDYTVPPRGLFVLGDNRDNSTDSRVWGEVPFDHVVAQVQGVLWSSHDGSLRSDRFFIDL